MDTLQAFISANAAALEELRAFCAALSDSELLTPMPAGWTPASVLVHCAFWDLRAEALIAKWQAEGVGPAPLDTDIINEATRLPFLAIPPREAVRVALAASEAANRAVAALDEALAREILEHGTTLQLDRAEHRRMHMEEITVALAARAH
ncbi:MAG: maleylpyruvate isomerase N-terminal domain-containing protein [Chloroflexi bacterium]|nr:maleylpyruvate isomerase N-terminal domain-containing protein [Chloroflexota bacterium]